MQKWTVTAVAVAALGLAACAGPSARDANKQDPPKRAADAAAARSNCPTETGSRVRREQARCQGPGQVVSREELERTGSPSLPDALRRTVPSLD